MGVRSRWARHWCSILWHIITTALS